jgi:hypothetical protein
MEAKCILDEVYDYLGRFIVYPSNHARIIHTLWIAHTHLIEAFDYTPRLCILSAEKRSGKSTLVKLTKVLSQKGEAFVNPSPASIYSIIEERQNENPACVPTLCIDEQDRLWAKKETSDIVAILDQGFERDNDGVPRVRQDSRSKKRHIERFNTFCPVLLAGIENSNIPDTILDRSVVIRMKRRVVSEPIERFKTRYKAEARELRERISQWAQENMGAAKDVVPAISEDLDDRYADICEPLFIVTELIGLAHLTRWKTYVRDAIGSYAQKRVDEESSRGILWLKEVRHIIGDKKRIFKQEILKELEIRLDMHRNTVNALFRKFDIPKEHSIQIRTKDGDKIERGWYAYEWRDVFSRYLNIDKSKAKSIKVDMGPKPMAAHEGNHKLLRNIREFFHLKEDDVITYEMFQDYVNKPA